MSENKNEVEIHGCIVCARSLPVKHAAVIN